MLLVIPLPAVSPWALLVGTIHSMSCPSAPARSLGCSLIDGTALESAPEGSLGKLSPNGGFLGAIASPAPSLVPCPHPHLLIPLEWCQTLLGSSACGAWLTVSGSVSAAWDLGSGEADGSGARAEAIPAMSL